ncbi:MAG: 50S ribosomal protein L35 [Nitrospirota bacterium]|jgi:large subunit ribosomal protein L35
MAKLKMKTHRGTAKRLKVTAGGKVKMHRAGMRHLLTGKPARIKRKLVQPGTADKTNLKAIRKLLPYG